MSAPVRRRRGWLRQTSPALRFVLAREKGGRLLCHVERAAAPGRWRAVPHLRLHGAPGFEVGAGAGAADLALSICAELFEAPRTLGAYRRPCGRALPAWLIWARLRERYLAGLEVSRGAQVELDGGELYTFALEQARRLQAGRPRLRGIAS